MVNDSMKSVEEYRHSKMKTPYANVIVEKIMGKPYFEIEYYDPEKEQTYIGYGSYCMDYVFKWLEEEFEIERPIADITPILRGRWISPHWRGSTSCANCSECGFEAQHSDFKGVQKYYKFCPNCGAKMDVDKVE